MPDRLAARFGWFALLGMLVWPFLSVIGPRLEGRALPVVSDAVIERYEPDGEVWSLVYGKAKKLRDCKFIRLDWSYGFESGRSVIVPVTFLESPKARGGGWFEFGPWRVELDPEKIDSKSFAYTVHRCHPFWLTESKFWP